jgi:hypothetical protein
VQPGSSGKPGTGRLRCPRKGFTHKKRQPKLPFSSCGRYLDSNNIVRLRAFLAIANGELNFLAFGEGFETAALDSAEVNKNVRAAFASDETKTFSFVEELDSTGGSRHLKYPEINNLSCCQVIIAMAGQRCAEKIMKTRKQDGVLPVITRETSYS